MASQSLFPPPGLTLLFEVDPCISLARIRSRPQKEIYETLEFQTRISHMYRKMARFLEKRGWNIVRIDASKDIKAVQAQVQLAVSDFLDIAL